MRIKVKDIPALRDSIALTQKGLCWICDVELSSVTPCLDHDHVTGRIRGVLCANCNGIEGKIHNLARRGSRGKPKYDYVSRILSYWNHFSALQREEHHPTYRTPDEKRLRKNKKARERRAKKSG